MRKAASQIYHQGVLLQKKEGTGKPGYHLLPERKEAHELRSKAIHKMLRDRHLGAELGRGSSEDGGGIGEGCRAEGGRVEGGRHVGSHVIARVQPHRQCRPIHAAVPLHASAKQTTSSEVISNDASKRAPCLILVSSDTVFGTKDVSVAYRCLQTGIYGMLRMLEEWPRIFSCYASCCTLLKVHGSTKPEPCMLHWLPD